MHRITKEGHMPLFRARAGHWRPDILLFARKKRGPSFHVCEINARFISMMITSSLQMSRGLDVSTVNVPLMNAVILAPSAPEIFFPSCFSTTSAWAVLTLFSTSL